MNKKGYRLSELKDRRLIAIISRVEFYKKTISWLKDKIVLFIRSLCELCEYFVIFVV